MIDELRDIQNLMAKAELVRECQIKYFRTRTDYDLRASKAAEKQLDELLIQLRKKGYNSAPFKLKTENTKLF